MATSHMLFVLINCDPEFRELIKETLSSLRMIKEIIMTDGHYQLIAKMESDDVTKMREVVAWKIQSLRNVKFTLTLLRSGQSYSADKKKSGSGIISPTMASILK